jgi:hypothetical protein
MARETAGFTWPPLREPMQKMMRASVRPITSALPVARILIKRRKVPRNSARRFRKFMVSTKAPKNLIRL